MFILFSNLMIFLSHETPKLTKDLPFCFINMLLRNYVEIDSNIYR